MEEVKERELRDRFIKEAREKENTASMLIAAVKLPTGAVEVITNTALIPTKVDYYKTAYDDRFRLNSNANVKIVGFMFI